MNGHCKRILGLAGALTIAGIGCGKGGSTGATGTPPASTALSIQGNLVEVSTPAPQSTAITLSVSAPLTYSELLVSCVTFTNPPVAGSGGPVDETGHFTISFPDGTVGASFGCFISSTADQSFMPIPMVFVDPSKLDLSGEPAKSTRLAVTSSINIPAVMLDLGAGTAQVDVSTIEASGTGSTANVVKSASGTTFDFSGNWIIDDVTAAGLTLPAGYVAPCTPDQAFEDYWTAATTGNWGAQQCNGPQVGMKLFMQRLAGKQFTPDATCLAAIDASRQQGTPVAACEGTIGTDARYAIQLWAPDGGGGDACVISHPAQPGDDTHDTCKTKWLARLAMMPTPEQMFTACGRKLGFSNVEARANGQVDLTSDPNYVASGTTTGAGDTHYYDGPFPFPTSVTLGDANLFGTCTSAPCKPFSQAQNNVTDGWKLDHAQLMFPQQNNCSPVPVAVAGTPAQAWRCYGDYYPSCVEQPPAACTNTSGAVRAFQENASLGCTDAAGTPVAFSNWQEFWCQPSDFGGGTCNVNCTSGAAVSWIHPDGTASPAGYSLSECSAKSINGAPTTFVPKDGSGQAVTGLTGAITCRTGGGLFDVSTASPTLMTGMNPWQKFRPAQAPAGQLCADMLTGTQLTGRDLDRLKLAQLQCYAQAYQRARGAGGGCNRDIQFNWGTDNWWEFVADNNGPTKARGEVIMELFNYTDTNAGSFSFVNSRMEGVQVSDATGYSKWVPCRVNEATSVTVSATSPTQLMLELTMVLDMSDRGNATCVAAVDDGRIRTGMQKMMFVATREYDVLPGTFAQ